MYILVFCFFRILAEPLYIEEVGVALGVVELVESHVDSEGLMGEHIGVDMDKE